MAAKTAPSKSSEQTFETAMQRLEAVVAEMESDQLPLEDLLTRYEEGIKLVKVCETKLDAAEKRIEIITRSTSGAPQIEEFEPEKKPSVEVREDVSLF